jgi:hypothetical protein
MTSSCAIELATASADPARLIPVKERETMGKMDITETQTGSSEVLHRSHLHHRTRLFFRRFRVRVPGGPPATPQVERPISVSIAATTWPPSPSLPRHGRGRVTSYELAARSFRSSAGALARKP